MTSDCLPLQVLDVRLVDLASVFKTNKPHEESAALAQLTARLSGADACLFLTCTSGSGMLPSGASQFVALLKALHRPKGDLSLSERAKEHSASGGGDDDVSEVRRRNAMSMLHSALLRSEVAVYGRGNSSYARYNSAAVEMDATFKEASFSELVPLTKGDELNDEEGTFRQWLKSVLGALAERGKIKAARCTAVCKELDEGGVVAAWDDTPAWIAEPVHPSLLDFHGHAEPVRCAAGKNEAMPLVGIVSSSTELLASRTCAHSTCLLRIDMTRAIQRNPSRLTRYEPGDHVRVYAENPPYIVLEMAVHLGMALEDCFDLRAKSSPSCAATPRGGSSHTHETNATRSEKLLQAAMAKAGTTHGLLLHFPTTVSIALTRYVSLMAPITRQLLLAIASCSPIDEADAELMRSLAADSATLNQCLRGSCLRVCDVFHLAPSLSAAKSLDRSPRYQILSALIMHAANQPRFYSIASSQIATPNQVSLLVSRVSFR